jgi:hypothetical protein
VGIDGPIGFRDPQPETPDIPTHRIAYHYLRQAVSHFLEGGGKLLLSPKLYNGLNWEAPEAHLLYLDVGHHIEDMVPEYIPLPDIIAAGGEDLVVTSTVVVVVETVVELDSFLSRCEGWHG